MRRVGRTTVHLLSGGATGVAAAGALLGVAVAGVLCLVLVGVPVLTRLLQGVRSLAAAERRRSGRLLGSVVPQRYPRFSGRTFARLRELLLDRATWRALVWSAVHAVTGPLLAVWWLALWLCAAGAPLVAAAWWTQPPDEPAVFFVVIDSWLRALTVPPLVFALSVALLGWAGPALATAQARMYRALLAPSASDRLAARVEQLSATRAAALDAHAAELRRIERDLHDGMQARLVTVAIQLGIAQHQRDADPGTADRLVERAHAGVEAALTALRDVVRSIYPPILADRGLAEAVRTLAAECPVPVSVTIGSVTRPPAAVESAAYYMVAEALTNIVKHSGATEATLTVSQRGDRMVVDVTDNGRGGADARRGTGLAGITNRAAALDGEAVLGSPSGGPTRLHVELPCGS